MEQTVFLRMTFLVLTSLLLFGCGGGSGGDESSQVQTPKPFVGDPAPINEPPPMYLSSGQGVELGPSRLHTVNPETGEIIDIGLIRDASGLGPVEPILSDLALTPGGTLFGCSFDTLYIMDKTNAEATPVGRFGFNNVNALAFDKTNGYLYGATTSGQVLNIDPNTGSASLVFNLSGGFVSSGDMVFSSDGTLYATLSHPDRVNDALAIIDLTNRSQILVGDGDIGARRFFGLSLFNGRLYGVTADGGLWQIDVETGKGTFLKDLVFSAFGSN